MVNSVTNLGRSGVYDWVIQRLTAVILALYTLFLLGYVLDTPDLTYDVWKDLFSCTAMKIFTFAALLSMCAHAWVGLWTISTDYLTSSAVVRFIFQLVCAGFLFTYLVWGFDILWGV